MTTFKLLLASAFLTTTFFAATTARAGGCPPCDSSADCPDGFCVYHDAGFGCQMVNPTCCPGQGCAIQNGQPSCVAAGTCCVVEEPGCLPNASTASSGATAGSGATNAASTGAAQGSTAATGATGAGAGSTSGGGTTSGGGGADGGSDDDGCTVAPTSSPHGDVRHLVLTAAAAIAIVTLRKRRN